MTSLTRSLLVTTLFVVGCAGSEPDPPVDSSSDCPVDAACDDGDLATANDRCRDDGVCAGEPIVCSTGPCIVSASPNGVDCDVTARPDGAVCDDQSVCTNGDRCMAGECSAGEPLICDDGDVCTEDACDPVTGCASAWIGGEGCVYNCAIGSDVLGHTGQHELTYAMDVVVEDGVAVIGTGTGIELYDVSEPTSPRRLGALALSGPVLALAVEDEVAYVSVRAGGVFTVDVSDPEVPTLLGEISPPGEVRGLHVEGTTAYLADDDLGLLIYDVVAPSAPTLTGFLNIPGWALDVDVSGDLAYVANRVGLLVIDVTNRADPKQVAFHDTAGYARGVHVEGLRAYMAYLTGVSSVDVTAPTEPEPWAQLATPGLACEFVVEDGVGYIADYNAGFAVVDAQREPYMEVLGTLETPGSAVQLDVVDTLVYLADLQAGLRIIDVTDHAAPVEIASIDNRGYGQSVQLQGDVAYVANGLSGLRIIDVSDATDPTPVGRLDSPTGGTWGVHVVGTTAYLARGEGGLAVADLTVPETPVELGSVVLAGDARDVQVIGPTAYVAAGEDGGLRIVDVTLSTSPVELGAVENIGPAKAVHVLDGVAYVAAGDAGLRIVDVTDARAPQALGTIETAGDARDVQILGNYAYVVDGEGYFYVLDASDRANPTILNTRKTPKAADGIHVVADIAYVACSEAGIIAYDVSDPTVLRTLLVAETPGEAIDLQIRGTTAYVADGSRALTAVALYPPCPGEDSACGATRCDASLGCVSVAGASLCDDGVDCTVDVCDGELGCLHAPGVGDCDDGIPCTVDTCSPSGGCGHVARHTLCDDQDACTTDSCEVADGCHFTDVDCDDELFCTGPETCHPQQGCQSNSPPALADDDPCTIDSCDEQADAVVHVFQADICDDGDACTLDTCHPGTGCAYEPVDCDDGKPCTVAICHWSVGCIQDLFPCDDEIFCNGLETCDGDGGCVPGTPPVLDDGVACTQDLCQEDFDSVAHVLQPSECDDSDACTTDTCDPELGCVHEPVVCDNGAFCDGLETCDTSVGCLLGEPPLLSDGVPCTVDMCDEDTDVVTHTPDDADCADGDACTADSCSATSGCSNPWIGGFGCGYNCSVSAGRLGGTPPHGRSIVDEVVAVGEHVYAATSVGLEIYDVSDPSDPLPRGWLIMRSLALDVVGHTAYVGTTDGSLQIVDVSLADKPAAIKKLGGFGQVHAVSVVDAVAYVATDAGLTLVDVSVPKHPDVLATLPLADAARDVEVVGFLVHVAASEAGLVTVDVSDPEDPVQVAQVSLPGSVRQLAISDDLAYVAARDAGLHVVDLSPLDSLEPAADAPEPEEPEEPEEPPPTPEVVQLSYDGQGAVAVAAVGATVYTTRLAEPMLVVSDAVAPDALTLLDTVDLAAGAFESAVGLHVAVAGTHAYVAAGMAGLRVVDVSAPSAVATLAVFDDLGQAQGVRFGDDGLVFVADGPGGFRVVDASDTAAPVEIWRDGLLDAPTRAVDLAEGRVYVVASDALRVRDADPNTDFEVVGQAALSDGHAVQAVDEIAFVADGSAGLRLFDVGATALSAGGPLPQLAQVVMEDAQAVHVVRGLAHVADGFAGLRVVDVQLPSDPITLVTLDLGDAVNGVQVLGPVAYITGENDGLHIVDVSEPDAPALISTQSLSGTIRGAHVIGTSASVTIGTSGLTFVNLSDLENPGGAGGVTLQPYDASLSYGAQPIGEIRRDGHLGFVASGALVLTALSIQPPCDDGDLCTADICDTVFGCSHPPDTDLCYDGDPCTQDLCSGPGECDNPIDPGASCDDDDATTMEDTCDPTGACIGTPYVCTPSQCQDSSIPNGADCDITLKEEGALCDDGDPTTHFDTCNGLGDCGGLSYTCTPTQCESSSTPNGEDCDVTYHDGTEGCDDGDLTTKDDVCDGAGGCAGTPYACIANQCEVTSTHNGVDCDVTYQDALHPCSDGDLSTRDDTCNGIGTCSGTPYVCTKTQCEASATPNGTDCDVIYHDGTESCDDGELLTKSDTCDGAGGCAGTPYTCTATQCEETSTPTGEGCDVTFFDASTGCDDEDLSTQVDTCDGAGGCAGTPYTCTATQCEETSTPNGDDCDVTFFDVATGCDDGDLGTRVDTCDGAGGCAGTPYTCTATQCEETSTVNGDDCDVAFFDTSTDCDDGALTTQGDSCDGGGTCVGTPYTCDAGVCVTASTHNGATCDIIFAPDGTPCVDGVAGTCNGLGVCVPSSLCPPQTMTFSQVGVVQDVTIPGCATAVTIEVWGAEGGFVTDASHAGKGGYAHGTMLGLAGQVLHIRVGGAGGEASTLAVAGFNGGGGHGAASGSFTVGGGGASDVRIGAQTLADRIIVGGGGGGSAGCNGAIAHGGHGGGEIAQAGGHSPGHVGAQGSGGMPTAGGAGGVGSDGGSSGSLGVGGNADNTAAGCDGAGAGGGGFYGGGGGSHGGGGGGGSSWIDPSMLDPQTLTGIQSGDGQVVISW